MLRMYLQPPASEIHQHINNLAANREHAKVLFSKITGTMINFQFQLLQIQLPELPVKLQRK